MAVFSIRPVTFHAGPDPFTDADDFGMEIRRSGAGTPLTGGEVARLERDLSVLQRELREQVTEADQLSHLARAMADSPDTMTLLQMLVESANEACQSAVTSVTRLLDEGTAIAVVSAGRPLASVAPPQAIMKRAGSPICGMCSDSFS